jgi:hypothetical protein
MRKPSGQRHGDPRGIQMTGFFKIAIVVLIGGALHLTTAIAQDATTATYLASDGATSLAG